MLSCLALAFGVNVLTASPDGIPHELAPSALLLAAFAAALTAAVRRRRTLGPVGWLLAGAIGTGILGDWAWTLNYELLHRDHLADWPDLFYFATYAQLIAAGVVVVRRRTARRDPSAFLDAATITVGLGVVVYVFLVANQLTDSDVPVLARVVGVAFPVLDVLVLGVLARLLVGAAGRRAALLLISAALASYLVGDLVYAAVVVEQLPLTAMPFINSCYAMFSLFLVLALWHPEAGRLLERTETEVERLGPGRAAALAVAGLLAPATLLVRDLTGSEPHVRAVATAAVVLFLLTLTRMLLLVRAVEAHRAQLEVLARTDALTGLANRRTYDHELGRAMRSAAGSGEPLSVGLLDLDRFKCFNDTHGHPAGDELLREAARTWSAELRWCLPGGTIARYGGEEFALVLPGLEAAAGAQVVERLLAVTPFGQTFSAGVAEWDGALAPHKLLGLADGRLYAAKAAGRARVLAVAVAVPAPPPAQAPAVPGPAAAGEAPVGAEAPGTGGDGV
ncbi:GGDEF domain-containing protein [Kineococcus xinjiangensis]|uniref:GGDEF domain-containing protein n=1 Tax=Kineococcus xinjiangensis TaxID=512762 RepID=UPI0011B0AD3B|nr:GGDEF domain-containing protein [Kineococcus xinjiangensis]